MKIDARFIRDFNETLEGVETEEILSLLKSLGCDEAQGYLISRPVAVRDAFALAECEFNIGPDGLNRVPGKGLAPPLSAQGSDTAIKRASAL